VKKALLDYAMELREGLSAAAQPSGVRRRLRALEKAGLVRAVAILGNRNLWGLTAAAKTARGSTYDPAHAHADGKARVRATIVWEITVGELRFRCLPIQHGGFVAQARSLGRWEDIRLSKTTNPRALLLRTVQSGSVTRALTP